MSVPAAGLRILLATDGSYGSATAEPYAYGLADLWGASLTVMSVLEFPPGMDPDYAVNRLYLDELMKDVTTKLTDLKTRAIALGISVQSYVATGIPSEEVSAVAQTQEAELIVVGTRGKTGLEHILLGSTAERIIRMAPCPVLTVPTVQQRAEGSTSTEKPNIPPKRMLVPVDFSDCSLDALEYGALVAQRSQASITLLHVLEPVSYGLDFTLPRVTKREHARTELTRRLSKLASTLTSAGVPSDFAISGGPAADSILDTARSRLGDLIIMGTHGRRGLSHTLFGSIAESVLRRSSCPVLTVRSPTFHPGHRRMLSSQLIPASH